MKKRITLAASAALMLFTMSSSVSGTAFFGETHCGNGSTKEAAAQAAERRAEAAAKRKGTCYDEVDMTKCTRESDGTWTCCTTSANHKGSCG